MSPIEQKMLDELRRRAAHDPAVDFESRDLGLMADGLDPAAIAVAFRRWSVFQELPVDGYRLDFAIIGDAMDAWQVAVECDGHDYHERTADQAAHDRRRDRYLQKEGWHVMRFTGREIVRDVAGCVDELVDLLDALQDKAERHWAYERDLMDRAGV